MSTELKALLDAMRARCDGAMNAYYYSFEGTGIVPIDRVLSMVARAGKGSHHTNMWRDDEYGPSHEQRIQEAANESAGEVRRLVAAVEAVLDKERKPDSDTWDLWDWGYDLALDEVEGLIRAALIGDDDE